jgi:hypothetical protein
MATALPEAFMAIWGKYPPYVLSASIKTGVFHAGVAAGGADEDPEPLHPARQTTKSTDITAWQNDILRIGFYLQHYIVLLSN